MKLEVGKVYVDRKGRRWTCVEFHLERPPYAQVLCRTTQLPAPRNERLFHPNGRFSREASEEHEFDLVAEDPTVSSLHAQTDTPSERAAIPHADLIRAVLDGKVVQFWSSGKWWDGDAEAGAKAILLMLQYPQTKYRLKPEPVVLWGVANAGGFFGCQHREHAQREIKQLAPGAKVLRIELDPDTLDVISATTEAP